VPPPTLKPKQVWIGIDPGFKGAIGAINERGHFLWVRDMPSTIRDDTSERTREFDLRGLASIVRDASLSPDPHVFLEYPTTRPDESAESSKRFGVGLGLLEGMFAYAGIPAVRVAPNKWKGRLGLVGKERDPMAAREQAVRFAEAFIPGCSCGILRGSRGGLLDGRAESLLIAWEALTSTRAGLAAQPYETRLARVMFGGGRRKRKGGPF
jgi:hypothetical protein